MSNLLINENSPYLLQHANNPVNWYPWCKEAFQLATKEDKPIFLSIGYSTCHWCHVMACESFENPQTAELLNNFFVAVKVDREERPDIDSVYMSVCQTLTGSGGWPMSIFMTPDKKPFYAGTYFPPYTRYGQTGFPDLLQIIAGQWHSNRDGLLQSAEKIIAHIRHAEAISFAVPTVGNPLSGSAANTDTMGELAVREAIRFFTDNFDWKNGGFGTAPKFPTPHNLIFLAVYAIQNNSSEIMHIMEKTLIQMRKGGIYDQIGYGFSRYSTDSLFLVPHFEKMLYDNALLIIAYTVAYHTTGKSFYLETAEQTAQYIFREMTSIDGGFFSAQDADSDGIEGKFYTFTLEEVLEVLGKKEGNAFAAAFDITANGNFEGTNIPNLLRSNNFTHDFDDALQKLYQYRKSRTQLHLDDKILTAWNSLMIAALSMLNRASKKGIYLYAAMKAQTYIEKNLCSGTALFTSCRHGHHSGHAVLDDYACYTFALTELYKSSLEESYLTKAERICRETVHQFLDETNGGFYLNPADSAELFINPMETYDGAIPSGNSVMAFNLVRLYQLTGKEHYREDAQRQLSFVLSNMQDYPAGHSMSLLAVQLFENPPRHITIVLKETRELEQLRLKLPLTSDITLIHGNSDKRFPLLNDQTTYYVCGQHKCMPPTNTMPL